MDTGFIAFFLDQMLQHHFVTKSSMARALGLTLRTVQTVFQKNTASKGASLVFVNTICYCYHHDISVDAIYLQYRSAAVEKKGTLLRYAKLIRYQQYLLIRTAATILWRLRYYAKFFIFPDKATPCKIAVNTPRRWHLSYESTWNPISYTAADA